MELGAGSVVDGARNYSIRTVGEFGSVQDVAETVIARRGGADIRLLDIAEVFLGYPEESSAAFINGESGIFVTVTRQSGSNALAVAERAHARLAEIAPLLPLDISLEVIQDTTTQIGEMMDELIGSALLGGLLAMVVLFLFLRNMKSTLIIAISIPFAILVTLLVMSLTGLTLNMLTMAGLILGIGLVIDCSIVVLENIFRYRERGTKPDISAILGTQEVMTSIFAATLTTLCVFIPMILFRNELGFIGIIVQDLIITVAISLTSSLFIAIFLVPVPASKYLPLFTRAQKPLKNKVLAAIDRGIEGAIVGLTNAYARLLAVALRRRIATVLIVAGAFVMSIAAMGRLPFVMMPPMNEDSFTLNVDMPLGTVHEDTLAVVMQIQEIALAEIGGIKNLVTEVEQSRGSISVTLDLGAPGADTSEQAMNRLRARFGDFPNAELGFAQGGGGFMGGSDIEMVLRIHDIGQGFATAQEIRDLLAETVPDLIEVSIDMTEGLPQVEVIVDRGRAFNLGLSIGAIAREIAAAMNGVAATTFRHEGGEYSVVLELREEDRQRLPDLGRIFVASNTGHLHHVANFAELERGEGPVNIRRLNQSRVIRITGTVAAGATAQGVEAQIMEVMDTRFILPEGVSLSYEGQAGEIGETLATFLMIIILAVILVFGTMAGVYESFKDPFINLFAIPLVLIGVVLIHMLTGQAMSMFSMIGIVMLVGIVTNNGIILVDYTKLLVGRGTPIRQACREAGEARLRPVLMSALTTILGLVPLAFFPGNSVGFIQPIGLTIIGGLVSATFITLFFIPVMYSLINEGRGNREIANRESKVAVLEETNLAEETPA